MITLALLFCLLGVAFGCLVLSVLSGYKLFRISSYELDDRDFFGMFVSVLLLTMLLASAGLLIISSITASMEIGLL